ncbi:inner nuclear membrane Man1 [Brachionus plicatilis]|uniref:Inner nuclear membrane Man1 n=1 Tax=Brachionus plicatilis TaxID=10195 RepID=A0A3M7SKX6_BRAPC|nr:inner nuclear membrane Man1 [Brachionus plicatilis]
MSQSSIIDDEHLIEELRRYGENILPTLATPGKSRTKVKNQINDANRDLFIKKLNHYRAKEKAEKNPSKQYQKQMNVSRSFQCSSTRIENFDEYDEDDDKNSDVQVIESERDNDIVPLDSNETQYEYIKVNDAYTSPLSSTRYSTGIYNDNTQNDNYYESMRSTSNYPNTTTQSPSNQELSYVKLKDRIELDKTLSKYRSEINEILTKTRVKNRSCSNNLINDDVIYTGTVLNSEVSSSNKHPEAKTLYCPRPKSSSIFNCLKFKLKQDTKPSAPSRTPSNLSRPTPDSSTEAGQKKASNLFHKKLKPIFSQSWISFSKILPYLFLVIFTIIALQYVRVKFSNDSFSFIKKIFSYSSPKNPKLDQTAKHFYCSDIKDTQCSQTKMLVRDLIEYLRIKSGQIDCSPLVEQNFDQKPTLPVEFTEKCIHLNKITDYLLNERGLVTNLEFKTEAIDSVLNAVMKNPHWNLRVLNASYADTNHKDDITYLMSTVSSKSLGCRVKELVHFLYVRLVMLCSVMLTLFIGYLSYKGLMSRRLEKDRKFFALIKQVTELVEKQYELSLMDPSNIKPFIAMSHVYDTLVEPSERAKKKKEWNDVVKFIEDHESRIHLETQFIDGEETLVWKWVVPKTQEQVKNFKINPNDGIGLANSTMINPTEQERDFNKENNLERAKTSVGWQGDAFSKSEKLSHSPTPCLKIRGMFDQAIIENDPLFAVKIQNDILKKCDSILHISCDRKSKEGCVYVKCLSNEAAGRAYQALNGTWYNGKLLNVKFLRSDRYLERFPDSINFTTPLSLI